MSRNVAVIAVVVLVLVAGGWFLMRPKQSTSPTLTQPTETPSSTESATPEGSDSGIMSEVREIKVTGTEFAFSPNTFSLKKGEKVRIVFTNSGKMPHDLRIDELGVATKVVSPGQTDTVEFTVEKTGNFPMYCNVGNHRAQGMEGKVSVQ